MGQEVANVIAVDMSRLLPLVPAGYTLVSASSLGLGGADQGVVAIANSRGFDPTVDGRTTTEREQAAIDVAIVVAEPPEAIAAGVNIPGAFYLYTLTIYTNDALYAASLQGAGMPVKFVNGIGYQRDIDDATGVGSLRVDVPDPHSAFSTVNSAFGYAPAPGAFNAVFWHNGPRGKAALHFLDEPFRQGTAISQIYTQPGSFMAELLDGGG